MGLLTTLADFVALLGGTAVLGVAAGWLGSKFFEQRMSKDLETFKSNLQVTQTTEIESFKGTLRVEHEKDLEQFRAVLRAQAFDREGVQSTRLAAYKELLGTVFIMKQEAWAVSHAAAARHRGDDIDVPSPDSEALVKFTRLVGWCSAMLSDDAAQVMRRLVERLRKAQVDLSEARIEDGADYQWFQNYADARKDALEEAYDRLVDIGREELGTAAPAQEPPAGENGLQPGRSPHRSSGNG
ncbi:MAG: hypothetical protein JRI25_01060 [Deltaproteobacteria bacterium]|nr:hypothetical protein [Deltaproteobacteria bacterium]